LGTPPKNNFFILVFIILQSVQPLWLRFFLQTIRIIRNKILQLEVEKNIFILIFILFENKYIKLSFKILGVNQLYYKNGPCSWTCHLTLNLFFTFQGWVVMVKSPHRYNPKVKHFVQVSYIMFSMKDYLMPRQVDIMVILMKLSGA
jgi:hypothetical protein